MGWNPPSGSRCQGVREGRRAGISCACFEDVQTKDGLWARAEGPEPVWPLSWNGQGRGGAAHPGRAWWGPAGGTLPCGAFGRGALDRRALPPGQLGAPAAATATLWAPSWGLLVMISQTLHLGLPKSLSVTSAAPSPTVTPDPGREGASPGALASDRSPSQMPRWGRGCQERCPRGSSSSCPHAAAVQQTRLVLGAVNSYTHVVPPFTELMRSQRWGPLPGGTRAYERTGQDGAMGSRDSAVGRRVGAGAEPPGDCPLSLPVRTALCPNGPVSPRPAAGSQHHPPPRRW